MFDFLPLRKFVVYGNSMTPFLQEGDVVLSLRWQKLKPNDIIVCRVNGRDIIKRIKKMRNDQYFVEGDNKNESTDSRNFGWITKKEIIGKVIKKI